MGSEDWMIIFKACSLVWYYFGLAEQLIAYDVLFF